MDWRRQADVLNGAESHNDLWRVGHGNAEWMFGTRNVPCFWLDKGVAHGCPFTGPTNHGAWICHTIRSRSSVVIEAKHSAKSFYALDRVRRQRLAAIGLNQSVVESLMISLLMIMIQERGGG